MPDKQTLVPTTGDLMAAMRLVDIGSGEFAYAMAGPAAIGGTFPTNALPVMGRDANSVTSRPFRLGIFGDQYIEGGGTTARLLSAAASVNNTLVKNAAGKLFFLGLTNKAAAIRYLKLFNKASAPAAGTDTPVLTFEIAVTAVPQYIPIPAGGLQFSAGIGFAITTGIADADTGALTAGDIAALNAIYT